MDFQQQERKLMLIKKTSSRIWLLYEPSSRFVIKPEGGQQCIFGVFLTKAVGVNENLGVEKQEKPLNPPTNRALYEPYVFGLIKDGLCIW